MALARAAPSRIRKASRASRRRSAVIAHRLDRSPTALDPSPEEHCKENAAATTPGPGTYKRREGKGIAGSLGDAPAFKFGTAAQREFPGNRDSVHVPGPGANDQPVPGAHSPEYTFAPHGSMDFGVARHRDQNEHVFISKAHSAQDMSRTDNPGPGQYNIGSTMGSMNSSYYMDAALSARGHPGFGFGTAKKFGEQKVQVFISKRHVDPDPASPGPIYDTRSAVCAGMERVNFGAQRRFFEHKGERSPGPAMYDTSHFASNQRPLTQGSAVTIGTSKRPEVARSTWVPGAGSYTPKNAAETSGARGMFSRMPSYSVASNIRSDPVAAGADPDEPGPGFYKVNGKEIQDLVKPRAGVTKFGKDTNRSTFMTTLPYPGPGTYDQHIPQSQKVAPTVTFGLTERSKNPKARFSTKLYISSLHTADHLGAGTPGPGQYPHHTGKGVARSIGDGASWKMGTSKRDNKKMFISRAHSKTEGPGDSGQVPGPGQYKPNVEVTSKFRSPGGSSFGTSKRPALATVKF